MPGRYLNQGFNAPLSPFAVDPVRNQRPNRVFPHERSALIAAIAALALNCVVPSTTGADDPGAGAEPDARHSATVEQLFLVPSSRGPLRSVAFNYKFPGMTSVEVRGVGVVPSHGSFQYLTTETSIQFIDPHTGKFILAVALDNPTRVMGGRSAIAIPSRADFPAAYRNGRWARSESFHQHLARVLNSKFPSGFLMDGESPNAFITSYRELEDVVKPLYARLAVLVESPAGQPATAAEFRVRYAAQERRSHTDWRAMDSGEAQKAAQRFVDSLIGELEGGSK